MSTDKSVMFFVACGCSALIGYYYGIRKHNTVVKDRKPVEIHEVIMFHDEGLNASKYFRNAVTPALERVVYYLNLPQHTLDVCMYVLTNADLCNALIKLKVRHVKIRLILDAEMAFAAKSFFYRLQRNSIEVRWIKSSNIMHHKFCLIDASTEHKNVVPLVMNGSLNWTKQATQGNYENVTVTSQQQIVEGYKKEFERLWLLFKPIV